MAEVSRRDVINAFQPAQEILDPKRFAGRRDEFSRALEALLSEGAHLCVYGQRGIGKSSFARQVSDVAEGKSAILDALALGDYKTEKFDFLALRVTCDDTVINLERLIQRALTSTDGFAPWVQEEVSKRIVQDARQFSVAPSGIGAKSQHHNTMETTPQKRGWVESFSEVVKDTQNVAKDGVLLIIDEFDRITDSSGLASLLKALANTKLKVMLVGVADDLKGLIAEHQSLQRQITEGAVLLPPMPPEEIEEILSKAEETLKDAIEFDQETKERIAELCNGQPYLAHLFGKYTLLEAFRSKRATVGAEELNNALSAIATEGHEATLEERYRSAVASSAQRETVLRAFAAITRDKIHNSEAYELCGSVEQPAVYLGHLRQTKYGAELVDRGNRYHEFKDALFKAYVNATPRRFNEV